MVSTCRKGKLASLVCTEQRSRSLRCVLPAQALGAHSGAQAGKAARPHGPCRARTPGEQVAPGRWAAAGRECAPVGEPGGAPAGAPAPLQLDLRRRCDGRRRRAPRPLRLRRARLACLAAIRLTPCCSAIKQTVCAQAHAPAVVTRKRTSRPGSKRGRQSTRRAPAQASGPSTAPPVSALASLAAAAAPAQAATDRVPAAGPAPAGALGDRGSRGSGTLAALAANCSHTSADAALQFAKAAYASTGMLPAGDSWCANPGQYSGRSQAGTYAAVWGPFGLRRGKWHAHASDGLHAVAVLLQPCLACQS